MRERFESILKRREKSDAILSTLCGLALIILSVLQHLTPKHLTGGWIGWISALLGVFIVVMLLYVIIFAIVFVINFVIEKWRVAFYGTVYGKVVIKNNDTTTIPLKNIEISYSSPFLEKPAFPVFSDAKGMFRFERVVPVHKPITLEAKVEKEHIYQHIGKIEGVKWFLGKPSLGLPLSSGVPKYVDFVISTCKKI